MRPALLAILLILCSGRLFSQPVANFTATPTSGCAPMVVSFTSTSTGSPTSYSWNFGTSSIPTSSAQNPTVPYTVPGTYTVSLTVSNASGSNTKTMTNYIVVKQVPAVTFSASPLTGCVGTAISFTPSITWNAPGSGTYNWDFGDGGSSAGANPTHSYMSGGSFTVKLTATNSTGCPATDTQASYINIYSQPSVNFAASDTAICALNGTTTFTANVSGSGPFSYVWDFGDGSGPSTASSPVTHSYSTVGSYTVRMSVTDSHGCTDSAKKVNYINVHTVTAGFTAPGNACQGGSVPVANTSTTSGATVSWDFGDGYTGNGGATAHTYTTAGNFTITEYVTVGGCTASTSSSITINPKPSVSFTYYPTNPCPWPVAVTFNGPSVSGVTYNWFFGDGFSGSGSTPTHTYGGNDTFTVTLNAYNSFGCSGSYAADVIIRPMVMKLKTDIDSGCAPLTVSFSDTLTTYDDYGVITPYPFSTASYYWNFGDGNTSGAAAPIHTYQFPGSYLVTTTITTSNGCSITDTVKILAGSKPTARFGASPRRICVNEPIQFSDSSFSSGLPINYWRWEFGDGKTSHLQNPIDYYNTPDTFDVTLVVGVNGCLDSLVKQQYIIVNYPKAKTLIHPSCDTPLLVHFVNQSLGETSHIYYFGDGSSSTAQTPDHQYATAGIYTVSLVAYNSSTGCKDSISYPVNLNPITFSFTAARTSLCKGDTIKLSSSVTGPMHATAYAWWLGTGGTPSFSWGVDSDKFVFPLSVTNGGYYSAALEVRDENGCTSTALLKTNYITVGAPKARFSAAPPMGCVPAAIVYKDSSYYPAPTSGVTRFWDFGDGTSATVTSANTTHTYPLPGSYGIKLIVTDNLGCMDSAFIANYLTVTHPVAIFSTQGSNACAGVPFTFFSSSIGNGLTYKWDFGDGNTSTASSPSHAYASTGTYTVRLIVTDNNGCSDALTKLNVVTVAGRPKAAFTMDDTLAVCPPLIVNFTNTSSGAISYIWNFGTGATSTLTNPSNTYIASKVYNVLLVATNTSGCRDTAYGRVRVLGYAGVLSYSPLKGCSPLTVNFKANNVDGVAGFIYDFGDGTTAGSTSTSFSHTYKKPGPFVPAITLTDNLGCSVKSNGLDTIKVDGVFAGFTFTPFPACDKGTLQFIDTSRGAYSALNPSSWRFHDGTTSNLSSPSKSYPGPGSYAVTLYTSTVSGCFDTFQSKVIFYPLPTIDAGPDTTICLSDSATLRPKGGLSYAWSPGASLSCAACTNPYAFPSINTRYTVVGTDANGCTNQDTMTVRIRTKTNASVSPGTQICSGDTIVLSAEGGGSYAWSPPKGLSASNIPNPHAAPDSTEHYMVIVRLASCIPDSAFVDVIVHPTPVVDAGKGETVIAGTPVQLQAIGSAFISTWEWTPSDGLSCTDCPAPEANPKRSTTYIITVNTEFNCHATDSVHITVVCDHNQVFLPNTFTPDGNGVNDVFYPRGKGLSVIKYFRIYDRWGEVVFERSNIQVDDRSQGWDGKKNGRLLSPDIYVFTVDAVCDTGEPIKWQGDVLLLR